MEKASAPQDLPPSTQAGGVGVQANVGEECIGEGRGEELKFNMLSKQLCEINNNFNFRPWIH